MSLHTIGQQRWSNGGESEFNSKCWSEKNKKTKSKNVQEDVH